jgi:hypothetical protein
MENPSTQQNPCPSENNDDNNNVNNFVSASIASKSFGDHLPETDTGTENSTPPTKSPLGLELQASHIP